MKTVLIIAYYFPPYTGIEGARIKSFADNFKANGFFPIVLTRHWSASKQQVWADYIREEKTPPAIEQNEDYMVVRVPHVHRWGYKIADGIGPLRPIYYWTQKLMGNLQPETETWRSFYRTALQLINQYTINVILVSCPPFNLVKLGHAIAEKSGIPFVADFRDTYDNNLLNKASHFTLAKKLDNYLMGFHIAKNLASCRLVISISNAMLDVVLKSRSIPRLIVTNGFEWKYFKQFAEIPARKDVFTITHLGSLYEVQDIDFLINGFSEFLAKRPASRIQFIGLSRSPAIVQKIQKALPEKNVVFTPRLPRDEALRLAAQAHIFFILGWKGYHGLPTGKIFEYLGMKKNILLAPSDGDEAEKIITLTNAGKIANSVSEMVQTLLKWHDEFIKCGYVDYFGKPEEIKKYSREVQAKKLTDSLREIV